MRPSQAFELHPPSFGIDTLKQDKFDVICIGSGWAGHVLAARVVKAGHSALLIEKELFGGECPFWACVPSKLMLYPNEVLKTAMAVGAVANAKLDVNAVIRRRDDFNFHHVDDNMTVQGFLDAGITLVRGVAKLTGIKEVVVTNGNMSKKLKAGLAVALCSGSEPIIPEAVRTIDPWTPRDACTATQAPAHLIIMGGGVVGCEMATAYVGFGSKVTLISSSATLLPAVDDEVGTLISDALRKRSVQVVLGEKVVSASGSSGKVVVKLSNGLEISGSELLVAAGRKAMLDVGLEQIGLEPARTIQVDKSFCVATPDGAPWLYALGDANGLAPYTHASRHQGRIAANIILQKGHMTPAQLMPQAIFTDPVVASVGLTSKAAKRQGSSVRVIRAPYQTIASSIQGDGEKGFAQCIIDDQDRILGFTLVGHNAAEVIHAGTTAIVAGLKLPDLVNVIASFPTCSEVYLNLLDAAGY